MTTVTFDQLKAAIYKLAEDFRKFERDNVSEDKQTLCDTGECGGATGDTIGSACAICAAMKVLADFEESIANMEKVAKRYFEARQGITAALIKTDCRPEEFMTAINKTNKEERDLRAMIGIQ